MRDIEGRHDRVVVKGLLGRVAWSPDGSRLAFARKSIWTVDLKSGRQQEISRTPDFATDLSWAPGGQWLVVGTLLEGIWIVRADGKSHGRLVKGSFDTGPSWSPDGRWIAYTHSDSPGFKPRSIFLTHPGGTGLRRLTNGFNDQFPSWAPDGKAIVFERRAIQRRGEAAAARRWSIYIVDLATTKVKHVRTPHGVGRVPAWRPNA